ncbi:hypothetical protein BO82DRAFT_431056 [Aspergillus uvarum CBS 121591]|uniref:FAR1 domain-containing protein n=1 Tax=Aspergillus uvarum CBS 121591 TaxID=1448315 RepID=A0A319D5Y2_9EURO|nr:hypothetical protein BO82DRAFT_431056 [Aspergillus uvarum CBS 121591]PYH83328.1 hypothetical protein BO82DRAFT_431056 [Aspergillus uvarum CBS 121591]
MAPATPASPFNCFAVAPPTDPNAPPPPPPDPSMLQLPPPLEGWYVSWQEALGKSQAFAESHGYRLVKKRSSRGETGGTQLKALYLICDRGIFKPSVAKIRKRPNRKRIGCPFDMSILWNSRQGLYQVRVRNPLHNHGPREKTPPREPSPGSNLPFLSEELPPRLGEEENEEDGEGEREGAEGTPSAESDAQQQQQQQQQPSKPAGKRIKIRGLRDVAVKAYCEWQESYVQSPLLKAEFRKARDVALENGLDLEQMHLDQDWEFFVENGVKKGIARRFIEDIGEWARLFEELSGK